MTRHLTVTLEEETVEAIERFLLVEQQSNREFSDEEIAQEVNVLARVGADVLRAVAKGEDPKDVLR